jgi:mannose-1-phosphate guanylyltransferase
VTFGVAADHVEAGYGYIRRARDPGPVAVSAPKFGSEPIISGIFHNLL